MKVYLVTYNGLVDGYGEEVFTAGIFSSFEKAKEVEEFTKVHLGLIEDASTETSIIELELDEVLDSDMNVMDPSKFGVYLGGYAE